MRFTSLTSVIFASFFLAAFIMQPTAHTVGVSQAQAASKGEAAESSGNVFVQLDPLVLPVVNDEGVSQMINMVIVLEIDSERKRDKIRELTPRLMDAYIRDLYGMLNRYAILHQGVVKVDIVKQRLAKINSYVLGEDYVEDVLLQVIEHRPL